MCIEVHRYISNKLKALVSQEINVKKVIIRLLHVKHILVKIHVIQKNPNKYCEYFSLLKTTSLFTDENSFFILKNTVTF